MQRWKQAATAVAVLTGSAVAAFTLTTSASGAEPPPPTTPKAEQHCVVRVLDKAPSGELRTTAPVCSATRAEAMQRVGAAPTDFPIGIHFDGPGLTGSSFTVVGADCTGGWLNINTTWINRVSSTLNGCPGIRHFDGYNLTGSSEETLAPGGNVSVLNNRTNSIQYLP